MKAALQEAISKGFNNIDPAVDTERPIDRADITGVRGFNNIDPAVDTESTNRARSRVPILEVSTISIQQWILKVLINSSSRRTPRVSTISIQQWILKVARFNCPISCSLVSTISIQQWILKAYRPSQQLSTSQT